MSGYSATVRRDGHDWLATRDQDPTIHTFAHTLEALRGEIADAIVAATDLPDDAALRVHLVAGDATSREALGDCGLPPARRRRVGVLLFDGFEPLDVIGPVELLGKLDERYDVTFHAEVPGLVAGALGVTLLADRPTGQDVDILLVPGGAGTRALVDDADFIARLSEWGERTPLVVSVCTGAALLARAGLLNGYRATSNKRAFDWVTTCGERVDWVRRARWVADRDRWTASGVAAGMDMTAALIAELDGPEVAASVCRRIELEVQVDPHEDPFAGVQQKGD